MKNILVHVHYGIIINDGKQQRVTNEQSSLAATPKSVLLKKNLISEENENNSAKVSNLMEEMSKTMEEISKMIAQNTSQNGNNITVTIFRR